MPGKQAGLSGPQTWQASMAGKSAGLADQQASISGRLIGLADLQGWQKSRGGTPEGLAGQLLESQKDWQARSFVKATSQAGLPWQ
jgi:hypothetical protein